LALNEVSEETPTSFFSSAVKRKKLLCEMLALIVENSRVKEDSIQAILQIKRLASAIKFINERYKERLSVDEIASVARLSKSQFHRNFKQAFGSSPLEYQKKLKLKEAQSLLLLSDKNISEITEEAGYGDQFHFSRIFKKQFGVSPLKFRQINNINLF